MRRRTTTQKLQQVITNNLLVIEKAEIYHKTTHQTDQISADQFKDSLDFLCETIFADAFGWHFERNYKTDNYAIETGRMNPDAEIIVTVYLGVCESVDGEEVEEVLSVSEEE